MPYAAPREPTFRAWIEEHALARWYLPGDESWSLRILEHDVRVGGRVRLSFGSKGGPLYLEEAHYEDIVENARLCYAMTITREGERVATSMVTIEFFDENGATRVRVTDQLVLFAAADFPGEREQGWSETLDRLVQFLAAR